MREKENRTTFRMGWILTDCVREKENRTTFRMGWILTETAGERKRTGLHLGWAGY